jgi:hypothetical protein
MLWNMLPVKRPLTLRKTEKNTAKSMVGRKELLPTHDENAPIEIRKPHCENSFHFTPESSFDDN